MIRAMKPKSIRFALLAILGGAILVGCPGNGDGDGQTTEGGEAINWDLHSYVTILPHPTQPDKCILSKSTPDDIDTIPAKQGHTIHWVNATSHPVELTFSESFSDGDQILSIPSKEAVRTTIPLDAEPGDYSFSISCVDGGVGGTKVVVDPGP